MRLLIETHLFQIIRENSFKKLLYPKSLYSNSEYNKQNLIEI